MRTEEIYTVRNGPVVTIVMNRPKERNCVNREIGERLLQEIMAFDRDPELKVCVLHGEGTFCAGADLKKFNNVMDPDMTQPGPMGISRFKTSKPVIASIVGHAVAGGIELALWCDLRVVDEDAIMGVFCRRFGVPLIDGGTVRLPRLIGRSRALDLILTGRPVGAVEAKEIGLANRIAKRGTCRQEAEKLALEIASFPPVCMNNDRRSVYEQEDLSFDEAMAREFELGMVTVDSGESIEGAKRFQAGVGRGGDFGGKSKL